jgi:hypothetical protein
VLVPFCFSKIQWLPPPSQQYFPSETRLSFHDPGFCIHFSISPPTRMEPGSSIHHPSASFRIKEHNAEIPGPGLSSLDLGLPTSPSPLCVAYAVSTRQSRTVTVPRMLTSQSSRCQGRAPDSMLHNRTSSLQQGPLSHLVSQAPGITISYFQMTSPA